MGEHHDSVEADERRVRDPAHGGKDMRELPDEAVLDDEAMTRLFLQYERSTRATAVGFASDRYRQQRLHPCLDGLILR